MAEIVAKLGVRREHGFLYFLRGSDVYKTPMKRAGGPSVAGKSEKVTAGQFTREPGYLYFVDTAGNVSRSLRAVGGQKRKKAKTTANKKVTKKATKKASAKGGAKKAATKKTAAKKPAKKAAAKKPAAKAKKK